MAFNMFPFTNLHNLNADWILKTIKEAKAAVDESLAAVRAALSDAVLYTAQTKTADEQAVARTNIGAASTDSVNTLSGRVNSLESSRVSYAAQQQLTPTQQQTARANIGAAPSIGVVRYNEVQVLGDSYKAQARENIGAVDEVEVDARISLIPAVRFEPQTLSDSEKLQARSNIGAISAGDIPPAASAVLYTAQELTDSQKSQARSNIGAAAVGSYLRYDLQTLTAAQKQQARANIGVSGAEDQPMMVSVYPDQLETGYECDTRVSDMIEQAQYGRLIVILFTPLNSDIRYQCVAQLDDESSPNTVVAHAYNPNDPASHQPFNWYRIALAAGSEADTLTVSEQSGWLVPLPQLGDQGKLLAVNNLGRPAWQQIQPAEVTDLESTSISLASASANTIYNYGELTSLTVTAIANPGDFIIRFTSGATPTTTNFPASMVFPEAFSAEANTRYEINVSNGYALAVGWPTT